MARSTRGKRWDDDDDEYDDRPRRKTAGTSKRKRKPAGPPVGLIVGGAVGAAAVVVVVIALLVGGRDRPPAPHAADPPPADAGLAIRINPPVQAEQGGWQRLTPADHVVAVMAPGEPKAVERSRLSFGHRSFGEQPQGWTATGTADVRYSVYQFPRPDDEPDLQDDPKVVSDRMMPLLGLGGMSEVTGDATVDGLPGKAYGPLKGFGISGIFVYRAVQLRDHTFVFVAGTKPDDPAAARFFDSIKFARSVDGSVRGPQPPSPAGMARLRVYLAFDNDPPEGAFDAISNVAVGRPVGTVGRTAGVRGQALDLTAPGSSFALTGLTATQVADKQSVTISVWFKCPRAVGTVFYAGVEPPNRTQPWPHVELGLMPDYPRSPGRQAVFVRRTGDPTRPFSETTIETPERLAGGWTHYALTRDGATGQLVVFINGSHKPGRFREKVTGPLGGPVAFQGGLTPVPKPEFEPQPDPKDRQPFRGQIDELAVFDRVLTDAEVLKLAGR